MPCISSILPIYNMESYLPRVLQSLRQQTLPDFEALLINDGSTLVIGKMFRRSLLEQQPPHVRDSVRCTALSCMHSRNDKIKLLLLKLRLYRTVVRLSSLNQQRKG